MTTPQTSSSAFATTRWTLVLLAKNESAQGSWRALELLCRQYWYPLYAHVRRSGRSPHDAQDLTQEFFARLLSKRWLVAAAPESGRFRTFLLVALKRFMANEWHRASALKRGGGELPLSLFSTEDGEQLYAGEQPMAHSPDELYERRWAMTLLAEVITRLESEFLRDGKQLELEFLRPWLTAARGEIPYANIAELLQCSETAVRICMHRMRKRFREIFREAVADTVSNGECVDEEIRHIVSVLGTG